MPMRFLFHITLILLTSLLLHINAHAYQPSTVYIFHRNNSTDSIDVTMASLSGIVAKTQPDFFIATPASINWLKLYTEKHPTIKTVDKLDPAFFIQRYNKLGLINGYILYDNNSINAATSIAGIHKAILVDQSTQHLATDANLPLIQDTRGKDETWVWEHYRNQLNKNLIFSQSPDKTYFLRDFAIMNNSFMFYEPKDKDTYLADQNDQTLVYGWAKTEQEFFGSASRHNLMGVAADWLAPIAPMSKWPASFNKQQTHTPIDTLAQPQKHYVAFVMSDGDNVQWLNNFFMWDSKWYGSPHRGKFTMNWDMSPEAPNINPTSFAHIYDTASIGKNKDFFVTAGGLGFTYPSKTKDIRSQIQTSVKAMKAVDQNVISVLDEYGVYLDKLAIMLEPDHIIGMMFKTGEAYKGDHGNLYWKHGKPILSVKYSLWDKFDTIQSITNDLNASPRDPQHNPASFTIVNVHPWSHEPMDSTWQIIQNLNDNIQVVTLEELFIIMRNNFGQPMRNPNTILAENFENLQQNPWQKSPKTNATTFGNSANTHTGSRAIGFNTTSNPNTSAQAYWLSPACPISNTQQVQLTFYYKTQTPTPTTAAVHIITNNKTTTSYQLDSTDNQWTKFEQTIALPQNAKDIAIKFSAPINLNNQIQIDTLRLTKTQ